jgi:hypothetical protein
MDIINTDNTDNTDIEIISIKIINDKYEIFLDKIFTKPSNQITTYIGRNIITNDKILIDVYTKNILFFARKLINNIIKLEHKNLHKILDIIIEKETTYIIKPFLHKIKNLDVNIKSLYFFKTIVDIIEYLYNNIEIEPLTINNILINNQSDKYVDKNVDKNAVDIIISPYFDNSDKIKHIIYGSPLYKPLNNIYKNDDKNLINNIINNIIKLGEEIITYKDETYHEILYILMEKRNNISNISDINKKIKNIKSNMKDNIDTCIFHLEL